MIIEVEQKLLDVLARIADALEAANAINEKTQTVMRSVAGDVHAEAVRRKSVQPAVIPITQQ